MSPQEHRPLYARMLRLRHLAPSGLLCFVFLEGAIALGVLLALAELVSWWGVIVLPVTVALMVKLNDAIAGSLTHPPAPAAPWSATVLAPPSQPPPSQPPPPSQRTASQPAAPIGEETTRLPGVIQPGVKRPWAERLEVHQQWVRQSATRRYE